MELAALLLLGLLVGTICTMMGNAGTEPPQRVDRSRFETPRRPLRAPRASVVSSLHQRRVLDRENVNHIRRMEVLRQTLERARGDGDTELAALTERLLRAEETRHELKAQRLAGD